MEQEGTRDTATRLRPVTLRPRRDHPLEERQCLHQAAPGRPRAPRKSMRPEHTRTLRTKQTQDGPKASRTRHDITEETRTKANTLTQITPVFSQLSLPSNRNKSKHKQMGLDQTYKLWHSKGDHKENEKQPTDRGRYLQMMQPIRD